MSDLKFYKGLEPEYFPGDIVWVVDEGFKVPPCESFVKVFSSTIRSVSCEMGDKEHFAATGYKLQTMTLRDGFDATHSRYLFKTEKEAKKAAKWYKVDLDDECYFLAIGSVRKGDKIERSSDNLDDIEDSELGICCANISDVRDYLMKCQKNKGLCQLDVDYVADCLNGCPLYDLGKNLKKILNSIGLDGEGKKI